MFSLQHIRIETRLFINFNLPIIDTHSSTFSIIKYFLLYMQRIYGPKAVVPRFFFDPVYNYKFEE